MPKVKMTVEKILRREELKDFADKVVSEDIDNIILIYRGKKNGSLVWTTTIKQWALIFGEMEMANHLMHMDWDEQAVGREDESEVV